jgi:long-chain-fatty-acid--CoA ligase ACSBG
MSEHQCVSVIGFNSMEWVVTCMAAILAGGFSAGIYTTNEPEAVYYIVDHSDSKVVVCEGMDQLNKLLVNMRRYTKLQAIVVWGVEEKDIPKNERVKVYSWDQFLSVGKDVPVTDLDYRMGLPEPGHCASIIYTSGTTGPPKAAMISHDNITWTSTVVGRVTQMNSEDRLVSFLPLSHIAAQLLDIHGAVVWGYAVHFARPDALKGSLVQTLKEAEPTVFFGVPRVWEKIEEKMMEVGKSTKGLKKLIANWAKAKGRQWTLHSQHGSKVREPSCFGCANAVVFKAIKKNLGLEKARVCVSGAAPISKDTLEYFGSLNIPIYELFGQSECTGPATAQVAGQWKIGTVGPALPGTTIKIDPDTKEIVYTGRHIFMGYLKMRDKTDESIDEDGYLHSGDIGQLDKDGFLTITGRIKELIKTSGGENIPPVLIEEEFKKAMPCISNAVVIGDKRKFLTILLTLKCKVDSLGVPTDQLVSYIYIYI